MNQPYIYIYPLHLEHYSALSRVPCAVYSMFPSVVYFIHSINSVYGTSLVVQWLRICLPMQGTQVRVLVWEDPTFCEATKPVRHNY